MNFLTGNRDIDYSIFHLLTNEELLELFLANKEMKQYIDNEMYWELRCKNIPQPKMSRIMNNIFKKPPHKNWKTYYNDILEHPFHFHIIIKLEGTHAMTMEIPFSQFTKIPRKIREGDIVCFFDCVGDDSSWKFIATTIENGIVTLKELTKYENDDSYTFPEGSVTASMLHFYKLCIFPICEIEKKIYVNIGPRTVLKVTMDEHETFHIIKIN